MSAGAALVWFRRDLRTDDHSALAHALQRHETVHAAFVFDSDILAPLPRDDRRVTFIWDSLQELREALQALNVPLHVRHGVALEQITQLAAALGVEAVYANRDYEPEARARDAAVEARLAEAGIAWRTFKDQVIFELADVRTQSGGVFQVFTPYLRAWLAALAEQPPRRAKVTPARVPPREHAATMPSLEQLGFRRSTTAVPAGMSAARAAWQHFKPLLDAYDTARDYPARAGTSGLSVHLRFGTISVRELVVHASACAAHGARVWLSELAWREFYFALLTDRPDVVDHAFRREYDGLRWDEDERLWRAWCDGMTGYPLVDAAMRELSASGRMHNRLRMVTASFLVKDLGLDWRRGERHFAALLLDYDLAANNGGWQWSASTGCDAQPWFRIFNPVSQSERFDPDGDYIRRWVPELARLDKGQIHAPWQLGPIEQAAAGCRIGTDYPAPVVDHAEARARTLKRFEAVRGRAPVSPKRPLIKKER